MVVAMMEAVVVIMVLVVDKMREIKVDKVMTQAVVVKIKDPLAVVAAVAVVD
jgi:hypothetical protein